MWELHYKESWALKNWCFWTEVLEKSLKVPWTARRSNQSILKEIGPEYSLEGQMLQLKLLYLGHLMHRADSLKKTLMLGKIEGRRRRGKQRMRWLDGIIDSMDMSLSMFQELVMDRKPGVLQSAGSQTVRHDWATELNWTIICFYFAIGYKRIFISTPKYSKIWEWSIFIKLFFLHNEQLW